MTERRGNPSVPFRGQLFPSGQLYADSGRNAICNGSTIFDEFGKISTVTDRISGLSTLRPPAPVRVKTPSNRVAFLRLGSVAKNVKVALVCGMKCSEYGTEARGSAIIARKMKNAKPIYITIFQYPSGLIPSRHLSLSQLGFRFWRIFHRATNQFWEDTRSIYNVSSQVTSQGSVSSARLQAVSPSPSVQRGNTLMPTVVIRTNSPKR